MQGRMQKPKNTTECPFCSCVVNNYHISRHIARHHANTQHTQYSVGEHPLTPPPYNDAPVRDHAQHLLHSGTNVSL